MTETAASSSKGRPAKKEAKANFFARIALFVRQIIGELRHQYVLAFEASPRAGWRPLQIRARKDSLTVRARSGYGGGAPASDFENVAVSAAPSGPATVR